MPLNPNILLSGQVPDAGQAIGQGLNNTRSIQDIMQGPQRNQLLEQQIQGQGLANEAQQQANMSQRDQIRLKSLVLGAQQVKPLLDSGDTVQALTALERRRQQLSSAGIDTSDTDEIIDLIDRNPELARKMVDDTVNLGASMGFGNKTDRVLGATDILDEHGKPQTVVPVVRNGQITNLPVGPSARPTTEDKINQKRQEAEIKVKQTRQEKRVTSSESRVQKVINNGIAANEQLPRLKRMRALVDRISTGGFSANTKAMTDFFGTTPADVGEFNNLAGQSVLDGLQSFSGAISEGERRFVEKMSLGLRQGGQVNKRDLDRLIQIAERARERALKRAKQLNDDFAIEDLQPLPDITDPDTTDIDTELDALRKKHGL